jgi:predicted P-loop ATPase
MSPYIPQLQPGQALVLCGPQGSGKTRTAMKIASKRGKYAQISSLLLTDPEALLDYLNSEPKTLIIENEGLIKPTIKVIEALITKDSITVRGRYGSPPRQVPVPQFIVCTQGGAVEWLNANTEDRRFFVVNL